MIFHHVWRAEMDAKSLLKQKNNLAIIVIVNSVKINNGNFD